ncbi:MAG: MarR family transcriptional regulator [Actinomycetota bacterium]|nr:MarR family transcriptional regulator [Actinomycetota bacterium]
MQPVTVDLVVAGRVGSAWRDLRRVASTPAVRASVYDPAAPLDPGQADALDAVVTHGPCRMSEVARGLRVDRSTATRAIDRLEAAGFVARRVDPNDARGVVVAATAAGRALLNRVRNRSTVMLAEVLATFSAEDRERLAELMERLVAGLDDQRSPAG